MNGNALPRNVYTTDSLRIMSALYQLLDALLPPRDGILHFWKEVIALIDLRKYGIGLVLAHQYFHQLEPDVRHAVLGNAGTLISFRVGAEDAAYLAREFEPVFETQDLIGLPNHRIYLRLMIDGEPSKPFSATTTVPAAA